MMLGLRLQGWPLRKVRSSVRASAPTTTGTFVGLRRGVGGTTSRKLPLVKGDDDDDILPIWSGKAEKVDPATVPKSARLGGQTLGEELELIYRAHGRAEADAEAAMRETLHSKNWDGDVYIGSNWNTLTVGMLLVFIVPVAGLLFAYLSYGKLWGLVPYY